MLNRNLCSIFSPLRTLQSPLFAESSQSQAKMTFCNVPPKTFVILKPRIFHWHAIAPVFPALDKLTTFIEFMNMKSIVLSPSDLTSFRSK